MRCWIRGTGGPMHRDVGGMHAGPQRSSCSTGRQPHSSARSSRPYARSPMMDCLIEQLLTPTHLYSAREVLDRPCPVPVRPAVYAWYFDQTPPKIETTGCHVHQGCT